MRGETVSFGGQMTLLPVHVRKSVRIEPYVSSAIAHPDAWFVHNDSPQWRTLTAKDFATMRRKAVIDGRRILERGA